MNYGGDSGVGGTGWVNFSIHELRVVNDSLILFVCRRYGASLAFITRCICEYSWLLLSSNCWLLTST